MENKVKFVRLPKTELEKYLNDPYQFKLDYDDFFAPSNRKNILIVDFWEDIEFLLDLMNLKEEKEEDDGYHYAEKKTIKKLFFSGEDIHWDMYYYYLKPEEVKKIARMIINLTKNDFEEVFGLCFLKCREYYPPLEDGSDDEVGIFNDLMKNFEELQRFYAFAVVNEEGMITFRI